MAISSEAQNAGTETPKLPKLVTLRARAKIHSQSWRADLHQIWLRRLSETAGVAGLRRGFRDRGAAKDSVKM